ncbi:PAS domain-containing protein [Variovorax sp. GT1P44]|uniref:PAS domain-containing protein n=1 Tax=Variovorax sp. GT1P44 TaxID=3443742 RepID=UPI003F48A2C5
MTDLSGYRLESLREGRKLGLFRGRQVQGAGPAKVLVVDVRSETQSPSELRQLENEYALASELDSAWAVRPIALVKKDNRTMLLLEDTGGETLEATLRTSIDVRRALFIAAGLAAALKEVHHRGLVHKDVSPSNVLVDSADHVRLTGFGLASRASTERQMPVAPDVIAGSFEYMSPEQTGRMNRSIDARCDLYSLGVVLYEMLVGQLPFTASDPMEWVHCHIARQPHPPSERAPTVSRYVDAIVLKLLAKNVEDRYQTAAGVESDLRYCLSELALHQRIDHFTIGVQDIADQLLMPEKLYGRQSESATLLAAFDRVAAAGRQELVVISGYSGVGKSSLVDEFHKSIFAKGGLFAAGKFDQFQRDIPFATLAQAFQSLVGQLLAKGDAELAQWRSSLLEALGPNGRVMLNLIPELVHVIGDQPTVQELPPQDSQNRFDLVLRRFLSVFARPEHPLVLFLDDLQWLDKATLGLLERLAIAPDAQPLLLLAAYRDNEVDPEHPLARSLETMRCAGAEVERIPLATLVPEDIRRLISDAMGTSKPDVRPLAELISEKTGGNPFFAKLFISTMAARGLIAFDASKVVWTWDMDRIREQNFTDNVVEFMVGKLSHFPRPTQAALSRLACLGNSADTDILGKILNLSEDELHAALRDAVREGLVLRRHATYTLLHDRVQEAAYALIPKEDRPAAHLSTGRALASGLTSTNTEHNIFEVVNQLNRAVTLIEAQPERERLAELNLIAAGRAKASTAYASALMYLDVGRTMLGENPWAKPYRIAFNLELQRAECEFLTGSPAAAEARLSALAPRAEGLVDRAAVTRLRMAIFTTMNSPDRAVEVGLEYLRHMELTWVPDPTAADIGGEFDQMWQSIGDRPIEELFELPLMTDANWRATMDVLVELVPTAMVASYRNLVDITLLRMVNVSLTHGHCDGSAYAFASLNIVLGFRFEDYQRALRFGEVGCDLVEKRGLDRFKTGAFANFGIFVVPWTKSMAIGSAMIRRGFDAAMATGNVAYSIYCSGSLVAHLLLAGTPLEQVHREGVLGLELARKAGFGLFMSCSFGELRLIQDLRGHPEDEVFLEDRGRTNGSFEMDLEDGGREMAFAAAICWVRKLQRCFFAGDWVGGVDAAKKAGRKFQEAPYILHVGDFHFYSALISAVAIDNAPADCRQHHLDALHEHYRQISIWARCCPENSGDRAALIGAEIARIEGKELDAQKLYEEAIYLARTNGFVQNEAIAFEMASRSFGARGYSLISITYLQQAHSLYLRWGAAGKARQLERLCPPLNTEEASPSSNVTSVGQLDHAAVVKISRVVSDEIVLDRLVEKLMTIAIEHAGAAKGLLILFGDRGARVVAEASVVSGRVIVTLREGPVTPLELPESILNYVIRTQQHVALDDATASGPYRGDSYIEIARPRSILCLPILKQARLTGALYIENNLLPRVFTPDRIAVLDLLASQAAVSLENAKLYADLEQENLDRKRAEQELRRSEMLLAQAQRLTLTSSLRWKVSTGEIAWSEESYRLMDYPPEITPTVDLILRRCHPDDLEYVQSHVARAATEGANLDMKHRLLMPDGTVKYVQIMARNIGLESQDFEFVGAVMDITEQQRTETRLQEALAKVRKSEQQLSTIIAAIPTMAWTTRPDGYAEFFSQRWLDYTGMTTAQAQGDGWAAALHPLDAPTHYSVWADTLASPRPVETEARMRRFDGEYRWLLFRAVPLLDSNGNVLNWYGTNTDIEDRKRAEDALRRSKAYMEHAQELSHTGSVGFRLFDGRVFWSKEAARIYGYDHSVPPTIEMVLQRVHPDDLDLLKQVFERAAQGGASFDFEHRLLMPDGSIKRIRNLAHSIKDDTGQEEVLGAVTDVTEQYKAKAALEEALSEVQRSEGRLLTLIDTIPALAWSALPNGPGDYYSQAYLRYCGMTMAQADGYGWATSVHPDDQQGLFRQWSRILESRMLGEAEARLRRFDGEYRWFLFRAAPVIDEKGNLLRWYGLNIDIDDLKRAETLLAGEKKLFEMIATGQALQAILETLCRLVEDLTDELNATVVLLDADEPRHLHRVAPSLPPHVTDEGRRVSLSGLRPSWTVPLLSSHRAALGTLEVYSRQARRITPRDEGIIERLTHLASIAVERKRADDSLKKREAFLAEGQRISRTGSFSWNARAGEIVWSDEMFRIFEFDVTEKLTYEAILQRIHPDDRASAQEAASHRDGSGWEVEYRLLMPNGSTKNLYVVAQLVTGDEGSLEIVGALMDITASRQSQAQLRDSLNEKEALLKEVHHRVKNNLQLISSLLSLQASRIKDAAVAELFADSRNRVRSMALVHENLYRAGDFSRISMTEHIQTLCNHLRRAYALSGTQVELVTDVDEMQLDLDRAISAGLIVNELVSNALKHAFPLNRPGRIVVELKLLANGTCRLGVRDNGIGLPSEYEDDYPDSLGLRLVGNLALQLHASTEVVRDGGTAFAIVFDAANGERAHS